MENTLILCGGTGAHVGVAFLRLHTLGYALGFFDQGGKPFEFPKVFLVDQDSGDGNDGEATAWQQVNALVSQHPGRFDWVAASGNPAGPELIKVTPLPVGANKLWYRPPHNTFENRFEGSPLLPVLASARQRRIDFSKGMMGSPAIGSLLFRLKEYDERDRGLNHDEAFGELLKRKGRIVVAGSGVGGTGASVGPTLARRLADRGNEVMAVMVLNWFEFDVQDADPERREKAAQRNRIMRENANSALEFYGQSLARSVAAVPIGMPNTSLTLRRYTSDVGQPTFESYVLAVAALCGERHFLLPERAFQPGLYVMGAVDRGRLTGDTSIPGGTLQDLANQAATVLETLQTFQRMLERPQGGLFAPALYEAIERHLEPGLVAVELAGEIRHYGQQLEWIRTTLGIEGQANRQLTLEAASRNRLGRERKPLPIAADWSPEEVALSLFHWTATWVKEIASQTNGLRLPAGEVHGGYWPDQRNPDAFGTSARKNGDLSRVQDDVIAAVLESFVDRESLSANGWPHPLAAADFFRHAIERSDRRAQRQLELLLVGLVSGTFELRAVPSQGLGGVLSLENLAITYRREGFDGLATYAVVDPRQGGLVVGFNSPHTLLCPIPYMDEGEDHRLWQRYWSELTGLTDGASWSEAESPESWGNQDLVVRQIRSWAEQQKRSRPGGKPPWLQLFTGYASGPRALPYGIGTLLPVYWGNVNDDSRPLVELSLPTREIGVWIPPEGTPKLPEPDMLDQVPALSELRKNGERLFWRVDFEVPEREGTLRGWWWDHLEALQQEGLIHIWSRTPSDALIVGVMREGVLHETTFANSRVLRREVVAVTSCVPFVQDPLPGSLRTAGEVRYPDLPVRADYLGLVQTKEGRSLVEALKAGGDLPAGPWRPSVTQDGNDHHVMRWSLRLDGRSTPLPLEIRLEETPKARAHCMVWPRFRSRSGGGWKAYYVYEHYDNANLFCDVIWLEGVRSPVGAVARLRRRIGQSGPLLAWAYPVGFRASADSPSHTGGPPVAMAARFGASGEEAGLYLIGLEVLPETPVDLKLAVDFGTSHSVAAFKIGAGEARTVGFPPELENVREGFSYHVSENREHVEASEKAVGIIASGAWLPTYRWRRAGRSEEGEAFEGLLPTELVLTRTLRQAEGDDVETWQPAKDYSIPALEISRGDLADYLLTDFKWNTGAASFLGREKELRKHYLGLFLELAYAEVIGRSLRGFPSRPVEMTFTYPLRSSSNEVGSFQEAMGVVMRRCHGSLGVDPVLCENVGLFDESRAARVSSHSPGEVCLVADLGGGTLDLFIAANNLGGERLDEVADSARIGGNLLLREIALQSALFLPEGGNWGSDPIETEGRLRAWMRAKGSAALFGMLAGGRPSLRLGDETVSGFELAAQASRARVLLDRYFRLIVEYLARNLTAFLVGQWFPKVDPALHSRLRISIQLRGNGWRLRYQDESYAKATEAIADAVRGRVEKLWEEIPDNKYPVPVGMETWERSVRYAVKDPKAAPVKQVVGQAMSFEAIRDLWCSHTLVGLEVMRGNGHPSEVSWNTRVPFETGGRREVHLTELSPPLVLSSPAEDRRFEVRSLDARLQGQINSALQKEGVIDPEKGTFLAPVAPLVWEAVFTSRDLWPDREVR